jgi:hypothetical protein
MFMKKMIRKSSISALKAGLIILMLFVLQGCFTLRHGTVAVDEGIELTNSNDEQVNGSFQVSKKVHHFVYGLVSPDDSGIEELVSNQVKMARGRKAVNVRIEYKQKFIDGLVAGLTFGIYTPYSLQVEGDIVK